MSSDDPDEAYNILEERVVSAIDESTKLVTPKAKPNNRWFDHDLIKLRIKRQRLHNALRKDKSTRNKERYNATDKEYGKLIIHKKREFNHARLDKFKFDLKRKWGVINDILGRKKKNGTIHSIYVDGVLTSDKEKSLTVLTNFSQTSLNLFTTNFPNSTMILVSTMLND